MTRKKGVAEDSRDFDRLFSEIESLKKEIFSLKQKYDSMSANEGQTSIPLNVFSKELSSLETIVKFLKENKLLSNKKIAKLTNRSEKTISQAYTSAVKKHHEKLIDSFSQFSFPVDILESRNLSVLENIVVYLKSNYDINFSAIGKLLHRNQRTIWTIYQRAKKKRQ